MGITPKQQRFVDEYLIDMNGTQAAIRAGYSAKTANEQAAQLLAKLSVAEAVQKAIESRSKRTSIDADWVLARLALEAEADLADLYDDNGNLRPINEWPLIWRQGLVAGVETVRERMTGEDGESSLVNKLKLSDRIKRIELIGRHVGVQAFKDRVEHDASDDLKAIWDQMMERRREHGIA